MFRVYFSFSFFFLFIFSFGVLLLLPLLLILLPFHLSFSQTWNEYNKSSKTIINIVMIALFIGSRLQYSPVPFLFSLCSVRIVIFFWLIRCVFIFRSVCLYPSYAIFRTSSSSGKRHSVMVVIVFFYSLICLFSLSLYFRHNSIVCCVYYVW